MVLSRSNSLPPPRGFDPPRGALLPFEQDAGRPIATQGQDLDLEEALFAEACLAQKPLRPSRSRAGA
jgi:hypothetical protein